MPTIFMPALSPTMESGALSRWLVKVGDKIEIGDIIAEIETDKAVMEMESIYEGTITNLLVAEGTSEITVNQAILEIINDEEPNEHLRPVKKSDLTEEFSGTKIITTKEFDPDESSLEPIINELNKSANERIFVSPLARRLAKQKNINLENIKGSGPKGRIIKNDIEQLKHSDFKNLTETEAVSIKSQNLLEIPLSPMRKTIAERMSIAKKEIPHFYLRRKANVDNLLKARIELNASLKPELKLSINDIIIKSCAKALHDIPQCKIIYENERIFQMEKSDISVAVAIDDGLITPIIREAELKSLGEISRESKILFDRAKEKKLKPEEYIGGCFSISNLGMMGVENFDAIINPPQTSILAIGKIFKQPIVDQETNQVLTCNVMALNLSVDHRAIDGALGAKLLDKITFYLENPIRLLN